MCKLVFTSMLDLVFVFFSNLPHVSVSGDFYIAELFDLHREIASMFVSNTLRKLDRCVHCSVSS